MRKDNRNFNTIGRVSCLSLLLLVFLLVNPFVDISVRALESDEVNDEATLTNDIDEVMELDAEGESDSVSHDNSIMPLADTSTNTSVVGISFSPAQYYASLSPTTSTGQSAKIDITATVNVYNSGGYTVYLKSNNGADLVGVKDSKNTIPGITGTNTYTYANMPVNTWGYASTEGTTVPSTANYKRIAVSGNGDKLAENTNTKITTDSKTIALSFATKINNTKPADTYSNTMMLSVVSEPLAVALTEIANLQDMTSDICAASTVGDEKQLKDTRDNKYYWVTKLKDGHCWMTQNLALDLATNPNASGGTVKTFYNTDTDLNSRTSWTPSSGTYNTVTSSTINANDTGQRSWNLGSYYIKTPNGTNSCGNQKNSLANCTSYFTALDTTTSANGDTNAHYITSHYYQWCAATAGCTSKTDTSKKEADFISGEAADSICPKGWRLPTSDTGGEFQTLMNQYSVTGDTTNLVSSPLYFVRGGFVYQDTGFLFYGAGFLGYYWSSTAKSGTNSYYLSFSTTSNINPSSNNYRQNGGSVRCLAK